MDLLLLLEEVSLDLLVLFACIVLDAIGSSKENVLTQDIVLFL